MTPRSLFNIILKILGIFFIKDILATIPQLLSTSVFLSEPNLSGAVFVFVSAVITLFVYIFVSYYLVFKSDRVIDIFRLDKGFDQETIPLNIHRSTILRVAIIVIGGLMIADEIPNLCRQLYAYFQEKRVPFSYSVLAAAKIIVGVLLVSYQRQIVNFVEHQRKDKSA